MNKVNVFVDSTLKVIIGELEVDDDNHNPIIDKDGFCIVNFPLILFEEIVEDANTGEKRNILKNQLLISSLGPVQYIRTKLLSIIKLNNYSEDLIEQIYSESCKQYKETWNKFLETRGEKV